MKKKIIISVIVIAVIIVGVVVFQNKNNQAPTEKIKVGVILPLSGQYASIGESIKNSMNMSLSDLENKNVELIFEDDRFDSKTALSAYNKLQTVDNVDIVVGLMSSTLETIKPIINKTDELMLTVGNEATIEKDNVFEVIPLATAAKIKARCETDLSPGKPFSVLITPFK
jgi:branched-chain amino acid transport system substrate-binding protein